MWHLLANPIYMCLVSIIPMDDIRPLFLPALLVVFPNTYNNNLLQVSPCITIRILYPPSVDNVMPILRSSMKNRRLRSVG